MHHIMVLQQQHPDLLPTSTIQGYQCSLLSNITLLGVHDLDKIGLVYLIISTWSCQELSQANIGHGLLNLKS